MNRRHEFASLLPRIVRSEADGEPIHLRQIYAAIERARPDLVDDEIEPPPSAAVRWQHELRWELETLVVTGKVQRRKDLGRGIYSAS